MTTQYFQHCGTVQEAKALLRRLARDLHPDTGGDHDAMATLTRQYRERARLLPDARWQDLLSVRSALVDPRRPLTVIVVNWSPDFVSFATITTRRMTYWTCRMNQEESDYWRARTVVDPTRGAQIVLSEIELKDLYERRIQKNAKKRH